MKTLPATRFELVENIYKRSRESLQTIRARLNRNLTLSEKVLFSHLSSPEHQELAPGQAYLSLKVDRVIMQDATAQMAILQFMQSNRERVAVPASVHCDHLIRAHEGASRDIQTAIQNNKEVYDFLRSACSKFGIDFWGPGSGIIHQVVLENYAFPGGLMIGSDSHTPNMGGLGMVAIGVGGADTVDAMAGYNWEVLQPKLVGVHLTGELKGWASPKDIILWVASQLTVKGGTNRLIEYFGPGARSLSATGKATVTNMGAEIGATTSVFPFDKQSYLYLKATRRSEIAELAMRNLELLSPDREVELNPGAYFDQVLELNLSTLEPMIAGPFSPDLVRPVSQLKEDAKTYGYPEKISVALIGSCTNSSYEDLSRAASVALEAKRNGAQVEVPLLVNPGSAQILETTTRDGQVESLEAVGAKVLANACGPCIGQWRRDDVRPDERNTIVNSYNRNFPARNDSNPNTLAFVASPEVVMAYALVGTLAVDPLNDELTAADGTRYRLSPPPRAEALPLQGYIGNGQGFEPPAEDPSKVQLLIGRASERLQILEPFEPIVEPELAEMPVLFKTKGKTTTDHISPAGLWLRFRGHIDRISDNLLSQAINAWTEKRGLTYNVYTHEQDQPVAKVARHYKKLSKRWIIVGDENYGEGSSREHAAMSPRHLGAAAVIARSFARIHESNLKKQGILPLTFANPVDYEKVLQGDVVTLEYLRELDPIRTINALFKHLDGSADIITLRHNLTMEQLAWFHAGSALNLIRQQRQKQLPIDSKADVSQKAS
ncbi:MAG: aconitate hydratase [Bdellovibrionota bacterium]